MQCDNDVRKSRRNFLYQISLIALSFPFIPAFSGVTGGISSRDEKRADRQSSADKLGIALVGLGSYAGGQLAPALRETKECYLAGIVTGTPSKIPVWQENYHIPDENVYDYDSFDSIRDNPDIDIVYVVLPNSMHAEYTIRAAQAGKHVICEKPMAITVEECDRMIAACRKAEKMLSIGYRLHFEPYNREMMRLGQNRVYGRIDRMRAGFGFRLGRPGQWRLRKELSGGGPLMDVGIYCVQGFCYTSGYEPLAVRAWEGPKTDPEKFAEVEQSLTWQFEMPEGIIADGESSYAKNISYLRAEAERGVFELTHAFGYSGQQGRTPDGPMHFPHVNQQARQMDDFALAVRNNRATPVPGEMGRRDVRYLQAIYEAMETGRRIAL